MKETSTSNTPLVDRLRTLRVQDVMSSHVVTIGLHDSMCDAAATLGRHAISGAPVVDEAGRCVGIISANDFVRRECPSAARAFKEGGGHELVQNGGDEPFHISDAPNDSVTRHMAPTVQTVPADSSLLMAAQIMCAQHIHRLPVVDESGRPTGMLTSLDVVAALVNAEGEFRSTK